MFAQIRSKIVNIGGPIPDKYRTNVYHLYLDVFWWGLLNGSTLAFLSIYASRIGANVVQVGFLTGIPALVNLMVTFPANSMSRSHSTRQMVRTSSLIMRMMYLVFIPMPLLLPKEMQVWMILALTLFLNVPGTILSIMFNAFFAECVPPEYRGQVVGIRNALLAAASIITSLLVGWILSVSSLEIGYTIVFSIGFVGGIMSVVHLFLIRPLPEDERVLQPVAEKTPGVPLTIKLKSWLRMDVCRGTFGKVLLLMFLFHIAINLPAPIFPVFQVNDLKLTDQVISIGGAIFWGIHMLVAVFSGQISRKLGFKKMTGIGAFIMTLSAFLFSQSYQPWIYFICQTVAGLAWVFINGGLVNYVLENAPDHDRAAHLSWYNIALNVALLISGLVGPQIAELIGLYNGLLLAVGLRFLAALAILFL